MKKEEFSSQKSGEKKIILGQERKESIEHVAYSIERRKKRKRGSQKPENRNVIENYTPPYVIPAQAGIQESESKLLFRKSYI